MLWFILLLDISEISGFLFELNLNSLYQNVSLDPFILLHIYLHMSDSFQSET